MRFAVFKTVTLLLCSNIFMTFAWYGHLKYKARPLMIVILVSWAIAFFEYCLQVPANRIGSDYLTGPQLKIVQEVITFVVFGVFSIYYLKQKPSLYDIGAFALVCAAVALSLLQPGSPSL